MTKILITGGAGFIGSHYILYLLRNTDVQIINVDALTYSANLLNLAEVEHNLNYTFIKADISDKKQIDNIFTHEIDQIVHFAAESHVDNSIENAEAFISSNIFGTFRLLEAARINGVKKFVHISTDEVYGSFPTGRADEKTPLNPGNPYSASKASSDLICQSFFNTYNLPVVITRCTNNYGPHQHPEKFIPKMINHLKQDEKISIYGSGMQERDWLYVEDHCSAIDLVRLKGRLGEVYHIGAEQTLPNIEVAEMLLELLNFSRDKIRYTGDRLGHDIRYSLDTSKISSELGWRPAVNFIDGLEQTVKWYVDNSKWWEQVRYR